MNGICLDTETYDAGVRVRRDALGKIAEGLVVGEIINQNEALILMCHQGEFKEHPMLGVGIDDITNDNDLKSWEHSIRVNLVRDNMNVRTVAIDKKTGNIEIEAEYKL